MRREKRYMYKFVLAVENRAEGKPPLNGGKMNCVKCNRKGVIGTLAGVGKLCARCFASIQASEADSSSRYSCLHTYLKKGFNNQAHFARGQLDAFQSVLNRLKEARSAEYERDKRYENPETD